MEGRLKNTQNELITRFFEHITSIAIAHSWQTPDVNRISPDHSYNIQIAYSNLAKMGASRIGFITNRWLSERVKHAWYGGYCIAQKQFDSAVKIPALEFEKLLKKYLKMDYKTQN